MLNRREFTRVVGGAAAALASSACGRSEAAAHTVENASATGPSTNPSPTNRLRIEIGGLCAFEWWRTEQKMQVHFLNGKSGQPMHPHHIVLMAEMHHVVGATRQPDFVSIVPGLDAAFGGWIVDGFEWAVPTVATSASTANSLVVNDNRIYVPCPPPQKRDDPETWRSVRWLPNFQQVYPGGKLSGSGSQFLSGRLTLTAGTVECRMPQDELVRHSMFHFADASQRMIEGTRRVLLDRVVYELPYSGNSVSLSGTSMTDSTTFFLKLQPKVGLVVPISMMALPIDGRRSPAHFNSFDALVTGGPRNATLVYDEDCNPKTSGDPASDEPQGPKRYPDDIPHCGGLLVVHPPLPID